MWFSKKKIDFLAIGDVFIDTFIELEDAHVSCDINHANCTISMRFGDKIPYKNETTVVGVGNAGNAAVATARLGFSSALLAMTGNDDDGEKIWKSHINEGVSTAFMQKIPGMTTNNAYVLQFGAERTILVKQEAYPYTVPEKVLADNMPKWIYLTSIGKSTTQFHHNLVKWLVAHPEVKLAFQPGTFQMQLGAAELADVYKRTDAFFCNKEEAQRILNLPTADFPELHKAMRALGPKMIVITDGVNGLTYSENNTEWFFLPMYPDPKPPVSRTGAGDATSSTITAYLAEGMPLSEAVLRGPINSMAVVQHVGAQTGLLSRTEIETYLKNAPAEYVLTKKPF